MFKELFTESLKIKLPKNSELKKMSIQELRDELHYLKSEFEKGPIEQYGYRLENREIQNKIKFIKELLKGKE